MAALPTRRVLAVLVVVGTVRFLRARARLPAARRRCKNQYSCFVHQLVPLCICIRGRQRHAGALHIADVTVKRIQVVSNGITLVLYFTALP